MRDRCFQLKFLNLILIILILTAYQVILHAWMQEEKIQQLEYQLEVKNATALSEPVVGTYKDGVYTGEGQGFGDIIKVNVTVKGGKITSIEVTKAEGEDSAYLDSAKAVIERIMKEQSTQVDTISGATFSSRGICEAVEVALEGAVE